MNLVKTSERLFRGMEVVRFNNKDGSVSYQGRYRTWRDLLAFYIEYRYYKEVKAALGWMRFFYHPVVFRDSQGWWFMVAPLGWLIELGRFLWMVWVAPLRFLRPRGYTNLSPNATPALFWPVHIRFRRRHHPGA